MKRQYNYHMAIINKKNEAVEQNLDLQIQAMLGSDKQSKSMSGLEEFINQYKAQNEWEIIDGLNIEKLRKSLEVEIEEFENNIDYVLSESNAITLIELSE